MVSCSKADWITDYAESQATLTRQVMWDSLNRVHQVSGIQQIRMTRGGTKNYNSENHVGFKVLTIHNHGDHIDTLGLGEFSQKLNGVHLRTRHNDYKLVKPVTNDKTYNAVESIKFPDLPPSVVKQKSLVNKMKELRKCFKAWKEENPKLCNYKPYFKPVLCYLEGVWTVYNDTTLHESFESDRHFLDALSFEELAAKSKLAANHGYKDNSENFAFLPWLLDADYKNPYNPLLRQFNYRIVCHPIQGDLPLSQFRPDDDFASRMDMSSNPQRWLASNGVRFSLENPISGKQVDQHLKYTLLDQLMEQVPGKENYGGVLRDNSCGIKSYNARTGKEINAAYYHRSKRTWHDRNLFIAKTANKNVMGVRVKCNGYDEIERWTFAIPLEVVYLSPLSKWNPFDIEYKGMAGSTLGKTVTANGRNGDKKNKAKAYNGLAHSIYYLTPTAFFSGGEINADAADTALGSVGVLNKRGQLKITVASGVRIFFPNISGVGVCRQRFPINSLASDDQTTYKELKALIAVVNDPLGYQYILPKPVKTTSGVTKAPQNKATQKAPTKAAETKVKVTTKPPVKGSVKIPRLRMTVVKNAHNNLRHTHDVKLSEGEVRYLLQKDTNEVTVKTSTAVGHTHTLVIKHRTKGDKYIYLKCDNRVTCFGNHSKFLINCDKLPKNKACTHKN